MVDRAVSQSFANIHVFSNIITRQVTGMWCGYWSHYTDAAILVSTTQNRVGAYVAIQGVLQKLYQCLFKVILWKSAKLIKTAKEPI